MGLFVGGERFDPLGEDLHFEEVVFVDFEVFLGIDAQAAIVVLEAFELAGAGVGLLGFEGEEPAHGAGDGREFVFDVGDELLDFGEGRIADFGTEGGGEFVPEDHVGLFFAGDVFIAMPAPAAGDEFDKVAVFGGVSAKGFEGKSPGAPGLIKGVLEEVVFGHDGVQFGANAHRFDYTSGLTGGFRGGGGLGRGRFWTG